MKVVGVSVLQRLSGLFMGDRESGFVSVYHLLL